MKTGGNYCDEPYSKRFGSDIELEKEFSLIIKALHFQ